MSTGGQLMALVDQLPAVVSMRDVQGRYLLVNREYERRTGLRREQVVGHTDHDLFPEPVADELRAHDRAALERGEPVQLPGRNTVAFPLTGDDGRAYAVCGFSVGDDTERRRAEELDALSYSVSHDLRAPLRSLDGFSQILLEEHAAGMNEEARGYLGRIRANIERMGDMFDALLELSHADRSQLRRERTDVSALAREVAADLAATEPGRAVRFDIADDLVARGDPHLIRLVLQNLLGNAFKFTSKRVDAVIAVSAEGDDFVVRDNGAGFDMGHADRMFDPFQRLHGAGEFEGTGIGLAIVRRIVARHGGRIDAEGKPGAGAVIRFNLVGRGQQ
ncbi:PAS domain-containing sensor histidine kinase [Paractinoplanes lichenicola]|uniref:Sensor-like histidine kinase SenX3 n=1 Tax=Paractinoplanes lichenicola TaxID=2802976 RepID=A0ABS1W1D7_9ACTN|nr:ATP-binding protein [Actinoplanes lichenicola]MBL7260514.1 PAS domain-containing protein [Actinoplanes lichenicola]